MAAMDTLSDDVAADVRSRMRDHLGGEPTEVASELVTAAPDAPVRLDAAADPVVSIVTVTYGTGPVIVDALAALAATLGDTPYEVVVVDQPPADDRALPVAARLRLLTSGVRLVSTRANHGFGGGNAIGVAHARAPIVVLLNPDAVVTPGWLDPLVAALADPTVGIAAPVLLDPDGSVQEAGQTLNRQGGTAPITVRPNVPIGDVTYASAACWALRRADYDALGGFDPRYHPAYFEDADLALRYARAGLRTVVVAASEVVHHTGTGARSRISWAARQHAIFRARWSTELAQLSG